MSGKRAATRAAELEPKRNGIGWGWYLLTWAFLLGVYAERCATPAPVDSWSHGIRGNTIVLPSPSSWFEPEPACEWTGEDGWLCC